MTHPYPPVGFVQTEHRGTQIRQKSESVLCFEWSGASELKIVAAHRRKYKGISSVLDRNPEILDRADRDLKALSVGGVEHFLS